MGVFAKMLKRKWSPSDDRWYNLPGQSTKAGVDVAENNAMNFLTVASCVLLISGDIAKLPFILYKRTGEKTKERATGHYLYDKIKAQPNAEMTSYIWRESKVGHLLLWGNTYDQVQRDAMGKIVGFWPINPEGVDIYRENGVLMYEWTGNDGKKRKKPKSEIFHIPGFGFDGLKGKSMISLARETIALGLAQEEFAANFYSKGAHPAGTLEMEGWLGERKNDFVENFREQYAGLGNTHAVAVLEGGAKYHPLGMSMEDSQFIQGQEFNEKKICGFYGVPPHKVAIHGSSTSYNNTEQENQHYVDSCLSHVVTRMETCSEIQLLSPAERKAGYMIRLEMKGLLRGDTAARTNLYQMFLNNGVPINRILELEDMEPVEGGDQGLVQLNMIPLSDLGKIQAEKVATKEPPTETKPDPDPKELKSFFRTAKHTRGIIVRDRIVKQYYPLFKQAAADIVNKEAISIKRQLGKRSESDITGWIEDFYNSMPDYIRKKIGPTFMSFSEAIRTAAGDEIGITPETIDKFVSDYIKTYADRHTGSSKNQLLKLINDEGEDSLEQRVDEWSEKRPDKIARNETVRLSSAAFSAVAFGAGLSIYWRTRGKDTCPYCMELNGRKISAGESFYNDGDEATPEGEPPMKMDGMKTHPPLHEGCECYISAG